MCRPLPCEPMSVLTARRRPYLRPPPNRRHNTGSADCCSNTYISFTRLFVWRLNVDSLLFCFCFWHFYSLWRWVCSLDVLYSYWSCDFLFCFRIVKPFNRQLFIKVFAKTRWTKPCRGDRCDMGVVIFKPFFHDRIFHKNDIKAPTVRWSGFS